MFGKSIHKFLLLIENAVVFLKSFFGITGYIKYYNFEGRWYYQERRTSWLEWFANYVYFCFFHSLISYYVFTESFFLFQHLIYFFLSIFFYYGLLPKSWAVFILSGFWYNRVVLKKIYSQTILPLICGLILFREVFPVFALAYYLLLIVVSGFTGLAEFFFYLYQASRVSQESYSKFLPSEILDYLHKKVDSTDSVGL